MLWGQASSGPREGHPREEAAWPWGRKGVRFQWCPVSHLQSKPQSCLCCLRCPGLEQVGAVETPLGLEVLGCGWEAGPPPLSMVGDLGQAQTSFCG